MDYVAQLLPALTAAIPVHVQQRNDTDFVVKVGEQTLSLTCHALAADEYLIASELCSWHVAVVCVGDRMQIQINEEIHELILQYWREKQQLTQENSVYESNKVQWLQAPMPGRVVAVLAAEGDMVGQGQVLVVLEAMKMENELRAPRAGRLQQLCVAINDTVEDGFKIACLTS